MKKKYKVFISGPMSGYPEYNRPMFDVCAEDLRAAGFDIFNPAWLDVDEEAWSKSELMSIDICALSHCDAICFLPGAENSSGSNLERDFAARMEIPAIWYLPDGPDGMDIFRVFYFGKSSRKPSIEKLINTYRRATND